MRAKAIMRRSMHEASRDTVVLRARRGPERSRDDAIRHQSGDYAASYSVASSETDELARDDSGHGLFGGTAWVYSSQFASESNQSVVLGERATTPHDAIYPYSRAISRRRRDSGVEVGDDVSPEASIALDGIGSVNSSDILGTTRPAFTSNPMLETRLLTSLPYRPRTRERSSSDPLDCIPGPLEQTAEMSSAQEEAATGIPRTLSEPNLERPRETEPNARRFSSTDSEDWVHHGRSAPPPLAILEAVGGLASPLDMLVEGVVIDDRSNSVEIIPHGGPQLWLPQTDGGADINSGLAVQSQDRMMPTLSRHPAVRMTPARRRQHARTSYIERHLQPNFAALRASRPQSEGSPRQLSGRRLPPGNQENMDEQQRLIEARRIWLLRGRTNGVLDETPPREGRFERYL